MFPLDTYLIHRFRKKQAGNVFPLLKVSKREKNIFFLYSNVLINDAQEILTPVLNMKPV